MDQRFRRRRHQRVYELSGTLNLKLHDQELMDDDETTGFTPAIGMQVHAHKKRSSQ